MINQIEIESFNQKISVQRVLGKIIGTKESQRLLLLVVFTEMKEQELMRC